MNELIYRFISILSDVLYVALIGRVILSWLNLSPESPITRIIEQITEPILLPIRRIIPRFVMLDFSPMIAILLITIIVRVARMILI